jgi:hypothetical protein
MVKKMKEVLPDYSLLAKIVPLIKQNAGKYIESGNEEQYLSYMELCNDLMGLQNHYELLSRGVQSRQEFDIHKYTLKDK